MRDGRLRAEDALRIRELWGRREQSVREMARFYGVSPESIRRVLRGDTWAGVGLGGGVVEYSREESAASEARLLALVEAKNGAVGGMLTELAAQLSPLDGGDCVDETGGAGVALLLDRAKQLGAK